MLFLIYSIYIFKYFLTDTTMMIKNSEEFLINDTKQSTSLLNNTLLFKNPDNLSIIDDEEKPNDVNTTCDSLTDFPSIQLPKIASNYGLNITEHYHSPYKTDNTKTPRINYIEKSLYASSGSGDINIEMTQQRKNCEIAEIYTDLTLSSDESLSFLDSSDNESDALSVIMSTGSSFTKGFYKPDEFIGENKTYIEPITINDSSLDETNLNNRDINKSNNLPTKNGTSNKTDVGHLHNLNYKKVKILFIDYINDISISDIFELFRQKCVKLLLASIPLRLIDMTRSKLTTISNYHIF